jgi:hypothetical protein
MAPSIPWEPLLFGDGRIAIEIVEEKIDMVGEGRCQVALRVLSTAAPFVNCSCVDCYCHELRPHDST